MIFLSCVLLHTLLRISVIEVTSSHRWSIVLVGTVINCCWGCLIQNQLVISCIEQRYCDFTTNSPAVMIFPSIVVLSCNIYDSDVKMIKSN